MKLLLYSHFFAPSVGGVETLVLSLARGLAGLRGASVESPIEVTLATQTSASGFDDGALGFGVIRQPSFSALRKAIRQSDVVHVAGPALAPVLLGFLERKPVVVEHHGFQTICPNGQLLIEPAGMPCPGHFMAGRHRECLRCNAGQGWGASLKLWLLTFLRRFLCRRVAANITPTVWLGELIQIPRMAAVPHGLEKPADSTPTSMRQPPGAIPVIAFQGRLVTTKGVHVLFAAARMLREQKRNFELRVIGDGPQRANLERLAQQPPLAGHVRFLGRLTGAELDVALVDSAAVVVPSLGGEVFGLVVAENMQRGLPVITSDLGAFVEVVGDRGLTFRTGDAMDLASAMAKILEDADLALRLGKHGQERASEFCDIRRMIDAHARIYREVLG